MESVSYSKFISQIAEDFNTSLEKEYTLNLPNIKGKIKGFTASVASRVRIFDGIEEHPYMLSKHLRNEDKFKQGVELRYLGEKGFDEIIKESGIQLKSSPCKICEGGGWSSQGTRYYYKETYCEF